MFVSALIAGTKYTFWLEAVVVQLGRWRIQAGLVWEIGNDICSGAIALASVVVHTIPIALFAHLAKPTDNFYGRGERGCL